MIHPYIAGVDYYMIWAVLLKNWKKFQTPVTDFWQTIENDIPNEDFSLSICTI